MHICRKISSKMKVKMMKIYIEKNKTTSEIFTAERVSQPSLLATVVMVEIISPSCQSVPPPLKLSSNMYSIVMFIVHI